MGDTQCRPLAGGFFERRIASRQIKEPSVVQPASGLLLVAKLMV